MPTCTTEASVEACIERFLSDVVSAPASFDGKVQNALSTFRRGEEVRYLHAKPSGSDDEE